MIEGETLISWAYKANKPISFLIEDVQITGLLPCVIDHFKESFLGWTTLVNEAHMPLPRDYQDIRSQGRFLPGSISLLE